MPPENIRLGGGAVATMLHPAVVVALFITAALILMLPRRYVLVPLLLSIFLIPMGQVLVVSGVHFPVSRIIVLVGCLRIARLIFSSPNKNMIGGFTSVDKAFALWAICYALFFVLQYGEMQAVINRSGFVIDAFGGYTLLRILIRDQSDVNRVIGIFAVIAAVVGLEMISEQFTRQNLFGLLGGVYSIPELRDGRIRSHGVFQHAILAGSFGATIMPLFVGLWAGNGRKLIAIVGIISSMAIVYTSSSSTPLLAFTAAMVGLCCWPLRRHMRLIRWGFVLVLISLQIIMKADVWWLISHVDLVGGSSYHRANLVDTFIKHFHDWWLIGAKGYDKWGWDMWDVSNQFVAMGLNGGLLGLIAFIAMISTAFGKLGTARKFGEFSHKHVWFVWCLGVALFAHVAAFFGTGYWDQTQFAWFALFAIIAASTTEMMKSPATQVVSSARATAPASAGTDLDSRIVRPRFTEA